MTTRDFYDISPEITSETAVFPGDQPFERNIVLDFKKKDNLVLSNITTTAHIGAHVDAPNHYHAEGVGISEVNVSRYIGLAQVIDVNATSSQRITPKDLSTQYIQAPRVLLRTNSFPNPNKWNDDFKALSPELISFLASKNVVLVGIDTPSIDPAHDKELVSHNEVYKKKLSILEGIVLTDVPQGLYILIAQPLRLKDLDASPVRALLFSADYDFRK